MHRLLVIDIWFFGTGKNFLEKNKITSNLLQESDDHDLFLRTDKFTNIYVIKSNLIPKEEWTIYSIFA